MNQNVVQSKHNRTDMLKETLVLLLNNVSLKHITTRQMVIPTAAKCQDFKYMFILCESNYCISIVVLTNRVT